ncbi:MAG: metal-dependent hydrolase [Gammaproteobacteria bacterium]|nr:metal-dependent hydrolase [Gammaproteobacteria bacterium]
MDLLTQGLLGATLAQSRASRAEMRIATMVGAFSGLLADADIFIYSSNDPLLTIEYHRHFTHSIFFIPLGALIACLLLWPLLKNRMDFRRLYLFSLLGYSMSGFIDACTSYGTYLFWPLIPERISFNIISIIDPLFTLPLLLMMWLALRTRRAVMARWGLLFAVFYLSLGGLQHQRAENVLQEWVQSRGHSIERSVVKPSLGNLLLWRTVYQYEGMLYVNAVRVGFFTNTIYNGDSVVLFRPERDATGLAQDSVLYRDIERFTRFSDGFVAITPDRPDVLADVRYALHPASVSPLWGITLNRQEPQQHARYQVYRDFSPPVRQRFLDMLLGKVEAGMAPL